MAASPLAISQFLQGSQFQKQQLGQNQQRLNIEQQQEQVQQAYQQQAARQADLDFHQKMIDLGALPVVNGMVQDSMTVPDAPGLYGKGQTVSIVRKADPSRTQKWKDSEGDDLSYEIPTAQQQAMRQVQLGAPGRAAQVEQTGQMAQAQATGAAAGRTAGVQADFNARAVRAGDVFTPDTVQKFGINPDYRDLPENFRAMFPAEFRATATQNAADTRTQGQNDRQAARIQSQRDLQQAKQDFAAQQQQQKLSYQNQWAQARNAMSSRTQSNSFNNAMVNQMDRSQAQHGKLLDQIYGEQQKQLEAQALLNPDVTADGDSFTDPWSGKQATMNGFQRARLKAGMDASNAQVADWRNSAQQLEQRYSLGNYSGATGSPVAPGTAPGPSGSTGGGAPGQRPAAGASGGAGQKFNPQTSRPYAVGDTVKLKSGQTVQIKSFNQDGTFNY